MCLYHLIYTVRRVLFTLAMPCPCYAPTMTFFSRPRHSTAVETRPEGYFLAFGFFRLPRRVPRSCYQTHTNLRWRSSVWNQTQCAWQQYTTKKTICYTVGLAIRIFPATMRTFTKDTALSEQSRGAAWRVWINVRHGSGTTCARHAMCESALMLFFPLFGRVVAPSPSRINSSKKGSGMEY